jgi:hypothetical protein
MADREIRVFSLSEANEVVPLISELTTQAVRQLEEIKQRYREGSGEGEEPAMPEAGLRDVEHTLAEWTEQVSELGGLPKGYFTVDFQSVDPEMLYCWTYGEEKIGFTHKVWENFSHRRPLDESAGTGPDNHLRWIN